MPYEYQPYPKCLYHPKLAPQGKTFQTSEETKGLERKGWVDTPAKFPKPSRLKTRFQVLKPWWAEWEWVFKAFGVIVGVIAGIIALIKVLA